MRIITVPDNIIIIVIWTGQLWHESRRLRVPIQGSYHARKWKKVLLLVGVVKKLSHHNSPKILYSENSL